MQKLFVKMAAFLIISLILCVGSVGAADGEVQVCFTYQKQSGFAKNQFAVWVENAQGDYVKTLYATEFTARGGYAKRPGSLPLWVNNSGLKNMTSEKVDAFSGPTPKPGRLCYVWDLTDASGAKVSDGDYKLFVAGTDGNDNQIVYTGDVLLNGTAAPIKPEPKFSGKKAEESRMLTEIGMEYIK